MEFVYKDMYVRLFRAVELAVRCLDDDKPVMAKAVLKLAQYQCEALYLEADENE